MSAKNKRHYRFQHEGKTIMVEWEKEAPTFTLRIKHKRKRVTCHWGDVYDFAIGQGTLSFPKAEGN